MSRLPEIPDEAVTAVLRNAGVPDADEGEREWARGDLLAAWPHLYAAALRNAADKLAAEAEAEHQRLRELVRKPPVRTKRRQPHWTNSGGEGVPARLRALADEATR
jgi:hypothetical protein